MKKISFLIALMLMAFGANAWADKVLDPDANYAYLEDTKVQAGTTVDIKLKVCAENQDDPQAQIGTVIGNFIFPEGVTINSVTGNNNACTFNASNNNKVVLGQCEGKEWVCTVNISVPEDMLTGDYEMSFANFQIVAHNAQDDAKGTHTTTLTVQKTAVIEPLTDGYSLEVLPFVAKEGASTIDVLFKSAATAKSVTFDIELPQGMMFYDENFDPSKPVLNASACTKTPTTTLTVTDETYANKASVSVMGQNTGAAALRKYINQLDELTTLVSIPVYVVPADEIADWGDEYALNEGVYEAKLNNIVVTDYTSNATFTGNYIASVIVGQPAQEEAILYGHFTSDAASTFTTALKNVAIADVTAATVDEGAKFTDVLVNEKGGNSYYTRTSANYGTTVLPLDLMVEGPNLQLYTVMDMTSEGIIIEEKDDVPANTPCIFKGTINAEGATPTLGVPSEQGLGQTTFKGTYEATSIAEGEGYYIASNGKFYNDGASIRPFRGYFDGAIAGVKSFSVLIDTPDGLKDITDQFSKEDIYNLQGIRMNNVQKGINIKGGKKILVK